MSYQLNKPTAACFTGIWNFLVLGFTNMGFALAGLPTAAMMAALHSPPDDGQSKDPLPGHPERLLPGCPPTPTEQALWNQLRPQTAHAWRSGT